MNRSTCSVCALAVATIAAAKVAADEIHLTTGDKLTGKVVAMDEKNVRIRNDVLGEMTVPRDKVEAMIFGSRSTAPRGIAPRVEAEPTTEKAARPEGWWKKYGETPEEILKDLVPQEFGPPQVQQLHRGDEPRGTPEEALEQLRREGVPPGLTDTLRQALPGFGAPEVQTYFHETVEGLASGSLTLDDLRKQAIDARDQLKELQDDLGPSGKALDGYRGILEAFIEETRPRASSETPSAP